MKVEDARDLLVRAEGDEEPVVLPLSVLSQLSIDDVPQGVAFEVGTVRKGIIFLEWNGMFHREMDRVYGEANHTQTRKYWYSPLGLEQYLDLVRRAVETRQRVRGDVALTHFDDDGAYVALYYRIDTAETNLRKIYDEVRRIGDEVEEAAHHATDEVGQRIAEVAARLSGWGASTLDALVDAVQTARNADEKGRTLEELCSRLFVSVPGLTVTGRIRTATEEIDITVLNDSQDPRLRREGAIVPVECKNWTGRCGKNEFVLFKEKLANRSRRSSLGILISWNGFADTVTKEMLRGSREEILIVPMTGEDVRTAVRDSDFARVLLACWDKATLL